MLRAFRRALEDGVPNRIELEEYTHFGMLARLHAGAAGLPFMPVRTNIGSDLPRHNRAIKTIANPYGEGEVSVVPALRVDVAIIHPSAPMPRATRRPGASSVSSGKRRTRPSASLWSRRRSSSLR